MKRSANNLNLNQDDLIKYVLAIQDDSQVGDCLDIDTLFDFINKDMDEQQFQKTIHHINTCSDCFYRWTETVSELQQHENSTIRKNIFSSKNLFADDYIKYTLALAACLIICIGIYLWPKNIETLINNSYEIASESIINGQSKILDIFQKSHSLSFVPTKTNNEDYNAFVSGVISGEQFFSHKAESTISKDNQYNIFYQTGRWVFLIKTICSSNETWPKTFWKKQLIVISRIIEKQNQNSYPVWSDKLKKIHSILLEQSESSVSQCCHEIITALDDLVYIIKQ